MGFGAKWSSRWNNNVIVHLLLEQVLSLSKCNDYGANQKYVKVVLTVVKKIDEKFSHRNFMSSVIRCSDFFVFNMYELIETALFMYSFSSARNSKKISHYLQHSHHYNVWNDQLLHYYHRSSLELKKKKLEVTSGGHTILELLWHCKVVVAEDLVVQDAVVGNYSEHPQASSLVE